MSAAAAKNEDMCIFLLHQELVDIKVFNNNGENLLHKAIQSGLTRLVSKLLGKKYDINSPVTTTNKTPLHLACSHVKTQKVYLIQQ